MDPSTFIPRLLHHPTAQLWMAISILTIITLKLTKLLSDIKRNPARLPLPPGPKGYPIIGNILDMPRSNQWRVYDDWAKTYGDVLSFEILGQRVVILNSLEAAQDLLEKRSAIYSDRPRWPMLELMDFGYNFGFRPYGSSWRRHRRAFNEHFRASAVQRYQPIQAQGTRAYLNKLLKSPQDFTSHLREALASVIMKISYGIEVEGFDDPYIVNVEESIKGLNLAAGQAGPGAFLVDLIPALKYVPNWFPGAGFKNKAAYWADVNKKVVTLPFNHVTRQIKEGTASSSIAASLIAGLPNGNQELLAEETTIAQNVAATAYLSGSDTTISAIQSFFLAMAMYPDVQKKAQAELDAVIGPQKLPEFVDRPSLPYVNALVMETLRWQLVLPLVPHRATEDDVYRGYFIPKGSVVLGNGWAVQHDEKVFDRPEEYYPERYLKDGKLDPHVRPPDIGAFGFGRRICPGRFFSDNSLFSIISCTLHVFNINRAIDEDGQQIPLSTEMTSGLLSYPKPFQVDVKPRSPTAEVLVQDSVLGDVVI
ncbi:hypothetical protein D9619_009098 [Psilocybe cf. subviscida]|uniref:Cytochrome P450 n=1 Tax=Psilocybe cf. subviscida TaxID=2480587 RepID=A0A8H5BUH8_9AGAR|nr:hypothetical protein D9619_009098 [Psilocybe cf. subviscida]